MILPPTAQQLSSYKASKGLTPIPNTNNTNGTDNEKLFKLIGNFIPSKKGPDVVFSDSHVENTDYRQSVKISKAKFKKSKKFVTKWINARPDIKEYFDNISFEPRDHQWYVMELLIKGFRPSNHYLKNVLEAFPSAGKSLIAAIMLPVLLKIHKSVIVTSIVKEGVEGIFNEFSMFFSNNKNKIQLKKLLGSKLKILSFVKNKSLDDLSSQISVTKDYKELYTSKEKYMLVFGTSTKLSNPKITAAINDYGFKVMIIDEAHKGFQNNGNKYHILSNGHVLSPDVIKKSVEWLHNLHMKHIIMLTGTGSTIQKCQHITPAGVQIHPDALTGFNYLGNISAFDLIDYMKIINVKRAKSRVKLIDTFIEKFSASFNINSPVKENSIIVLPNSTEGETLYNLCMLKLHEKLGMQFHDQMVMRFSGSHNADLTSIDVQAKLNDPGNPVRIVFIKRKLGTAINVPGFKNIVYLNKIKNKQGIFLDVNQQITRTVRLIPVNGFSSFKEIETYGSLDDYKDFCEANTVNIFMTDESYNNFENDLQTYYASEDFIQSRHEFIMESLERRNYNALSVITPKKVKVEKEINLDFSNLNVIPSNDFNVICSRLANLNGTVEDISEASGIIIKNKDTADNGASGKVIEGAVTGTPPNNSPEPDCGTFEFKADLLKTHVKIGQMKIVDFLSLDGKTENFLFCTDLGVKSQRILIAQMLEGDGKWFNKTVDTDTALFVDIIGDTEMTNNFVRSIMALRTKIIKMMTLGLSNLSGNHSEAIKRSKSLLNGEESIIVVESFDTDKEASLLSKSFKIFLNKRYIDQPHIKDKITFDLAPFK